jgi:YidC/Oxa1 family membrane protein insertase
VFPIASKQFPVDGEDAQARARMQQLKERYGDDRQKLQMATMELYKKER